MNLLATGRRNFRETLAAALVIVAGAVLFSTSLLINSWLYVAVAIGCAALIYAFVRKPQIWIYVVVLSLYFFFNTNQEDAGAGGLGGQEIAFGLFYHGSLITWFCWQIFVLRKKLVRSGADRLFLLFLAALSLNFFVAYFNDIEPMKWVRGWQYYLLFLYYFPIREYFSDERDLRRLLVVWGISTLYTGIAYLYEYKSLAMNFKWANQVYYIGVRRAGFFYSTASILCLAGILLDKGRLKKILWMTGFVFVLIILIISLARTAWVSFTISSVILALILPLRERLRLAAYSAGIGAVVVAATFLVAPRIANVALTIIELRFNSSSNISNDPSYLSRTMENESLLAGIAEYPLGGQGLQKEHVRYDLIDMRHIVSIYGHNGYFTFAYLVGIPLAALFYGILGYYVLAALRRARQAGDILSRLLYAGVGCGFINAFIGNIMGSVFDQREGLFITAFLIGFFGIAEKLELRRRAAASPQFAGTLQQAE
ncbi:hypothetical protein MASR2M18_02330 [Ignavibacteria bacterium]|nr:O-antigen ligase family protein [Bacteroidota bacterium]MCZ2133073.1 O-antigen ligase family protein [Bacteroidota bacterium]